MEPRHMLRLALGLVLALAMLGGPGAPATAQQPGRGTFPRIQPTTKHPKIDSQLMGVALAFAQRGESAALDEARKRRLIVIRSKVRVVVESAGRDRSGALAAIRAAGGDVELESGNAIRALLPPSAIQRVGEDPAVRLLRLPARPVPVDLTPSDPGKLLNPCIDPGICPKPKPVDGEGVKATNADKWHAAGFTGAGQNVAVIDVGFKGYKARQATGDLPATLVTKDNCEAGMFDGPDALPHGTAVAEVVHEMAPDAALHLVCVADEVTLNMGAGFVSSLNNLIVNHSVTWPNTSRGDGTFPPADFEHGVSPEETVQQLSQLGALWVNAAGNETKAHWAGFFDDTNADGWNNFPVPFTTTNQEYIELHVPAGQEFCVHLKWDDWPASNVDYDLYVFLTSSILLASSENEQSGTQRPTETACSANLDNFTQTYWIAIQKASGSANPPKRFDLFTPKSTLQFPEAAVSVGEPATSPKAMAAGAICWKNDVLMSYSSRGTTIDARIKPDIAGPSHVSSASYGEFKSCSADSFSGGFGGTSAAAPHVAGAAALRKQASPSSTAADLQSWLEKRAIDLGVSGKDNLYGAGKLWLGEPTSDIATICCPPEKIKIKMRQSQGPDSQDVEFEAVANLCKDCTVARVQWSFGDGQTSERNPVVHHYEQPGTYRVSLAVTDNRGLTLATSETIDVRQPVRR